jgi:hypothetical protein
LIPRFRQSQQADGGTPLDLHVTAISQSMPLQERVGENSASWLDALKLRAGLQATQSCPALPVRSAGTKNVSVATG